MIIDRFSELAALAAGVEARVALEPHVGSIVCTSARALDVKRGRRQRRLRHKSRHQPLRRAGRSHRRGGRRPRGRGDHLRGQGPDRRGAELQVPRSGRRRFRLRRFGQANGAGGLRRQHLGRDQHLRSASPVTTPTPPPSNPTRSCPRHSRRRASALEGKSMSEAGKVARVARWAAAAADRQHARQRIGVAGRGRARRGLRRRHRPRAGDGGEARHRARFRFRRGNARGGEAGRDHGRDRPQASFRACDDGAAARRQRDHRKADHDFARGSLHLARDREGPRRQARRGVSTQVFPGRAAHAQSDRRRQDRPSDGRRVHRAVGTRPRLFRARRLARHLEGRGRRP